MGNSSQISHFILGAYLHSGHLKYLSFVIVLLLYVLIVFSNVLLIVVISLNRSLHEPMYIFLCNMFVNELYGSTGLFVLLLVQILSENHTVPYVFCFLQIFCVYSYGSVEFSNFAIMSYDRYLAICFPLQYNTYMRSSKVLTLIVFSWFLPCLAIAVLLSLLAPLKLCGNIINKVYCDNYSIVKLACHDTTVNNIYGLIYAFSLTSSLVSLILYTYIKIFKVCYSGSKESRQKAVSTCTPHLASLLNFSFGALFEIVQNRFQMNNVPNMLRIFLSVYFFTCQPLFNPVMYGLKISKIRVKCINLLCA